MIKGSKIWKGVCQYTPIKESELVSLTIHELEVLHLVVQGVRNGEIAQRLFISVKTVETHLTSLYGKLGVQSRAEAIALAQRQGLLLENGK